MINFTYYTPTKVFFGKGVENGVGDFIRDYGAKKTLVHFGGSSAEKSGLMPRIRDNLKAAGVAFVELGGVEANPKVQLVRKAVELCKAEGVDFILAVGGGSVIDSAKSTALAVASGIDPWDIVARKAIPKKTLPVASVLTIAAAGSEMSDSHVLSDSTIHAKKGYNTDLVRPVAAFMNPELTYSVPRFQTACGTIDIMMHTMERYYTRDNDTELIDNIAEGLLLSVKNAGVVAIQKPDDYTARANLMLASSLSHNGLTGCGKDNRGLSVHQLAHGVTALFEKVPHGEALAILYPAWAKFVCKYDVKRFEKMAVKVWGIDAAKGTETERALAGIDAMENYFKQLGSATKLSEVGITPDSFEELADYPTNGGKTSVFSYIPLDKAAVLCILELAK